MIRAVWRKWSGLRDNSALVNMSLYERSLLLSIDAENGTYI